jgi:hypothetical protein
LASQEQSETGQEIPTQTCFSVILVMTLLFSRNCRTLAMRRKSHRFRQVAVKTSAAVVPETSENAADPACLIPQMDESLTADRNLLERLYWI